MQFSLRLLFIATALMALLVVVGQELGFPFASMLVALLAAHLFVFYQVFMSTSHFSRTGQGRWVLVSFAVAVCGIILSAYLTYAGL